MKRNEWKMLNAAFLIPSHIGKRRQRYQKALKFIPRNLALFARN